MTAISKNEYIDKLDDVVNKYNNTYSSTNKMEPVDVKSNTYINSSKETKDENHEFKIGDIVKVAKCKNIFECCVPTWSEEVLVVTKVKNTVPWRYVISDFKGQEIVRIAKNKSKEFRVAKLIKRKADKLCVTWKGYDSFCNSWIYKKEKSEIFRRKN